MTAEQNIKRIKLTFRIATLAGLAFFMVNWFWLIVPMLERSGDEPLPTWIVWGVPFFCIIPVLGFVEFMTRLVIRWSTDDRPLDTSETTPDA